MTTKRDFLMVAGAALVATPVSAAQQYQVACLSYDITCQPSILAFETVNTPEQALAVVNKAFKAWLVEGGCDKVANGWHDGKCYSSRAYFENADKLRQAGHVGMADGWADGWQYITDELVASDDAGESYFYGAINKVGA